MTSEGRHPDGQTSAGLKVLMIAPTSFFSDYGGHIRILEEARLLQAWGHQVKIVTYYKGKDVPGLQIKRTRPLPYRADYEVGSSRHKIAFDFFLFWTSLRAAWQMRPDLVHGHMHEGTLIGWVIARLLGVPLIFDYQGSLTAEMVDHRFLQPDSWLFRLAHRLETFINHRPFAILTSSKQAADGLQREFAVPAERVISLPDCVDITAFDRARFSEEERRQQRRALGVPEDRPLVVYLGLLTDYQGIPHMLQAAAHLKRAGHEIYFLIMGFPNLDHYKRIAQQLDVADRVRFTGRIPFDQAPFFLSLGQMALTAKMSSTEGSGKMLNYMALGLPTVAYDTPVHRQYLSDDGVYVPVGDVVGLAEAIYRLSLDPAERQRIGRSLRARAEAEFTWETAVRIILEQYRQALSDAADSP